VFGGSRPVAALTPLDLVRNPQAWPSPPQPGSPAPTAAPF
jgi:hypothetical protein